MQKKKNERSQEMTTYHWIYNGMKVMNVLVNKIYVTGDLTKYFIDIMMIILPKKNLAKNCSNHSTINLISHTRKIAACILSKVE